MTSSPYLSDYFKQAQDSKAHVRFQLVSGNKISGHIEKIGKNFLIIVTENDQTLFVIETQIESICFMDNLTYIEQVAKEKNLL